MPQHQSPLQLRRYGGSRHSTGLWLLQGNCWFATPTLDMQPAVELQKQDFEPPRLHHFAVPIRPQAAASPDPNFNTPIGKSSIPTEDRERVPTHVELAPGDVEGLSLRRPLFRALRILNVSLCYHRRDHSCTVSIGKKHNI